MFGGVYYAGIGFSLTMIFTPYVDTPISIPSGPPTSWEGSTSQQDQWSTVSKAADIWANNDTKLPGVWAPTASGDDTAWINSDDKEQTTWATDDKNTSQWADNDVKQPQGWTSSLKFLDIWTNNIIKAPSIFTAVVSYASLWNINYQPLQTYFYNESYMTYNDPAAQYNYLINGNQLNQRLVTRWTGVG